MQVGIIADDLTGAMDSGAQLARAGYRTAVAFHGSPLPPAPDLDAVAVDTDSRRLEPEAAAERVREATRKLKNAGIFYKKLDSTLRGPIVAELEAALEESGRSRAIIAPAFPSTGRTTRGGVQLLDGEPLHETRLAEDPVTPVREAHLPSLLADAGLEKVGALGIGYLGVPGRFREVLEGCRWIVADATEDAHLKALVETVPDPSEVLWAGSAGLVVALGEAYPGSETGMTPVESPVADSRILTVVGSTNPAGCGQLRRLDESSAAELVPLRSDRLLDGYGRATEEALRSCRSALGKGMGVALYSTDDEVPEGSAGRIVEALAEVVAVLSDEGSFDALVLTGGDTAVHVARRLGAQGILLEGEIEPGVPVGALIGGRSYRVITKAGGFGAPETLIHAQEFLAGKELKI
ncbi:four-carbon acid sugar kinase family protein [soil metagenome]